MPALHTRSQKSKATPKTASRSAIPVATPKPGNSKTLLCPGPAISAQERETLIARAAYFRAEKRGFAPGSELQDWIEAEAELLRLTRGV
jgi:Protein of unknown function (DUF2934)